MSTYWFVLGIAVFTEIVWAMSLKYIQLHPSPWTIGGSFLLSCCNMALLSYAMRGLSPSTAYAIWVGLGSVGMTLGSAYFFKDPVTPLRLVFIGFITLGVVGLKLVSKAA